ncbi:type VI secretion system tube protein TssD [Aquimarina longa]|uniref:type VI secretion system tube protein TssD n=1 Tax=Aquimarina longa TaxID=1080221 RepID=UPI000784E6B9|nr:type VI secretion system tube protein TssD [Aquimarina longa]
MSTQHTTRFYIDGHSLPVLAYREIIQQQTNYNGMPSSIPYGSGIYQLVVPDIGRWTHLLDNWALSPTMRKECKIETQSIQGTTMFKTLELWDTYCTRLEYQDGGYDGAIYTLTLSAATVIRNGEVITSKWWRIKDPNTRNEPIQQAEELNPQIVRGWWSYDQQGEEVYNFADKTTDVIPLGDTMYFNVQTDDIPVGETIELQLFDYDHFFWVDRLNADTSKFPNDPVTKTATVDSRGIASVALVLNEKWEPVIDDDHDDVIDLDHTIELYWQVRYDNPSNNPIKRELPAGKSDYLRVGYSDRTLYFKPAVIGHNLPEFIAHDGSPLLFMKSATQQIVKGRIKAKTAVKDKIVTGINKAIDKRISNIALAKLERGNMVVNTGKVYTNPKAGIYNKNLYTNDGKLLTDIKIRKNFGFRQGDNLTTTKGLSQYDYFSQSGARVKILGLLKQIGSTISFFDLFKFGMDEEEAGTNPLAIQGIAGLGGLGATIALAFDVAGILIQPIKAEWDEALDMAIEEELEIAKTKGLNAVRQFVNAYSHTKAHKWELMALSKETANKMLKGEFRTFEELENFESNLESYDNSRTRVEILYRISKKTNRNINNYIIETIFIDE